MDVQPAAPTPLSSLPPFPSDVLAHLQQQYHTAAAAARDGYLNSLRSIFVQGESCCITGLQINLLAHSHTGTEDPAGAARSPGAKKWDRHFITHKKGETNRHTHTQNKRSNNRSRHSCWTFLHFSLSFGAGGRKIAFLN